MAKKETAIRTRAKRATAVAALGSISLWDNQNRDSIPSCLILDKLSQLVVGHIRDDTVHPFAFGILSDTLEVAKDNNRIRLPGLIDYPPTNLMADVIDLFLLSMPYFSGKYLIGRNAIDQLC